MYYKIKKEFNISCSHKLHNNELSNQDNMKCFGKCNSFHGHNYKIIVKLKAKSLEKNTNMILNFTDLKMLFNKFIDERFDHKCLNDDFAFSERIPTAENMARVFYEILKEKISDIYEVEIFETDSASASYGEE